MRGTFGAPTPSSCRLGEHGTGRSTAVLQEAAHITPAWQCQQSQQRQSTRCCPCPCHRRTLCSAGWATLDNWCSTTHAPRAHACRETFEYKYSIQSKPGRRVDWQPSIKNQRLTPGAEVIPWGLRGEQVAAV